MKKLFPYLLVTLIFALVLNLSLPSYRYINTHDEDDNIVSGFLMSRNGYRLGRDIFSHHLPGAYLISELLDKTFKPQSTNQSVFVHRTFVTVWNYDWAMLLVAIWGPSFCWLIVVAELLRALYLSSLFHAENLVVYPMIYLILTLFQRHKIRPLVSGLAIGLVTILLAPLWPLALISMTSFFFLNRYQLRNLAWGGAAFFATVLWCLFRIDIREFWLQFLGYNAQTYAPRLIGNPWLYSLKAFLAPGMVLFDFSWSTKIVVIQLLILSVFVFGVRRIGLIKWIAFGLLLGVIGFRSTPRFHNPPLDFHVLPWVLSLAALSWLKFFEIRTKRNHYWMLILALPVVFLLWKPNDYFPKKEQAGQMVIRYTDDSAVVSFLTTKKRRGDTLFTLPAHTLLYQQTGIRPFNKFLFFLPWMEQSPVLFPELMDSFKENLPTFIFIDSIHFPYTPPEEIRRLLVNYRKVIVAEEEPLVYVLKEVEKERFD